MISIFKWLLSFYLIFEIALLTIKLYSFDLAKCIRKNFARPRTAPLSDWAPNCDNRPERSAGLTARITSPGYHQLKPYLEFKEKFASSCKTATFKDAINKIEQYMKNGTLEELQALENPNQNDKAEEGRFDE